jgi:DNA-directed RNA polymerase subunit RPC12/RpoP
MVNGEANTICTGCNRKQNLIEMLRVKKTKSTYKIICPYCGSDKIRALTDKVNDDD